MKILIAEDEPDIYNLYKIALEDRNHQVLIAEDGEECLEMYREESLNQNGIRGSFVAKAEENLQLPHVKNYLPSSPPSSLLEYYSSWSPPSSFNYSPFDAVVLDYRMPKMDGIEVAKEILKLNPKQRIIFASAYVKESLEDSVRQLNQVVELMQKPFEPDVLVDTIEDREIATGLEKLMINLRAIKAQYSDPTLDQIRDLLEGLRKIQKGRTF